MPYARKRGNQVAIVQGEREKATGKVQQRILFTLYSKEEAREAIGLGEKNGDHRFRSLLECQYPGISFNWKKLTRDIQTHLDVLPDEYPYGQSRLQERFRRDLCSFVRQLVLTDPQNLHASAELISEHHHELEYLVDLIKWRLKLRRQKKDQWNAADRFYWRFELQGYGIPPEAEEFPEAYYERGDLTRAEAIFRLLVESFPEYAEGHNYLGLIALQHDQLEAAEGHFLKTMEAGRRLFPARMARKRYWRDLQTRPYIRGLANLALTLNRAGKYAEALDTCRRLETECGDDIGADAHRASVYLNLGRWQEAAAAAKRLKGISPDMGFIAAFALAELGHREEMLAAFLHAAIYRPRAARMLAGVGGPAKKVEFKQEAEDHNAGVNLLRDLRGYLDTRPGARRLFRKVLQLERVEALLDEAQHVVRRWRHQHAKGQREAFDRMHEMQRTDFAMERARELLPVVFPGIGTTTRGNPGHNGV